MTEEAPIPTDHVGIREVSSVDDLVTVTVFCQFDGWATSHSSVVAQDASDQCAADWAEHAPGITL
ncbi:MAG TPA: hypothetical protein VMT27_09835 [Actinomycetes bacterium]|nr:hypothetical protein [Actinomycetes bacterium]